MVKLQVLPEPWLSLQVMEQITKAGEPVILPVRIAQNGTYYAGADKASGYNPVMVDVDMTPAKEEGYLNGYEAGAKEGYRVGYDNGNQWWFDWIKSRRSVDSLFMEAPIETVPNGIDFSNATVATNLFRKCENLKSLPTINTTNAQSLGYMFYYTKFVEPVEVTVDIRSAVNVSGLVANSAKIKRLNLIGDFSTVTTSNNMVQWASDLEEIHAYTDETLSVEIPLDMSNNTSANSMQYGNELKYARFVPGSIKVSQGFYDRNLTEETKQSIVEGLADLTGLATQTLTMGATLTDEQKAIVSAKNWTLVSKGG